MCHFYKNKVISHKMNIKMGLENSLQNGTFKKIPIFKTARWNNSKHFSWIYQIQDTTTRSLHIHLQTYGSLESRKTVFKGLTQSPHFSQPMHHFSAEKATSTTLLFILLYHMKMFSAIYVPSGSSTVWSSRNGYIVSCLRDKDFRACWQAVTQLPERDKVEKNKIRPRNLYTLCNGYTVVAEKSLNYTTLTGPFISFKNCYFKTKPSTWQRVGRTSKGYKTPVYNPTKIFTLMKQKVTWALRQSPYTNIFIFQELIAHLKRVALSDKN